VSFKFQDGDGYLMTITINETYCLSERQVYGNKKKKRGRSSLSFILYTNSQNMVFLIQFCLLIGLFETEFFNYLTLCTFLKFPIM